MIGGRWFPALLGAMVVAVFALLAAAFRPVGDRCVFDAGLPVPEMDDHGMNPMHGLSIHYTLDGSVPDERAPLYRGGTLPRPASRIERLLAERTSVQWRHPKGPLPEAMIVQARVFDGKGHHGPLALRTLLPNDAHHLPVISIALPPAALFDADSGIYTLGHAIFHDADLVQRYPDDPRWWKYPGNFHFRGGAWERHAMMEFIHEGVRWTSPIELRINGNNTRGFPQHALRLSFPGKSEGRRRLGRSTVVLRAGGNDQDRAFMRDAVQHELCDGAPFATSSSELCVVYVNGAYWGLHELRSRMDADGIAGRYGMDARTITVLEDRAVLDHGDPAMVNDFMRWVRRSERWDPQASWYADSLGRGVDLDPFLSYMAAQVILGNSDWPDQNVKYWRVNVPDPAAGGTSDGRWRFVMGDSDLGLGFNGGSEVDILAHLRTRKGPVARLFNASMRNRALRGRFRELVNELIEGRLSANAMASVITGSRERMEAEMPAHIRRWRRPLTMQRWNDEVDILLSFAEQRGPIVLQQMDRHLPLERTP